MEGLIIDIGEEEAMRLLKQVMENNVLLLNLQRQILELQITENQKKKRQQEKKWRRKENKERWKKEEQRRRRIE